MGLGGVEVGEALGKIHRAVLVGDTGHAADDFECRESVRTHKLVQVRQQQRCGRLVTTEYRQLHLLVAEDIRQAFLREQNAVERNFVLCSIEDGLNILQRIDRIFIAIRP